MSSMIALTRFWSKVADDTPDGCWLWTAYRTPDGYGQLSGLRRAGALAHRVAWEIANMREIPAGLYVLHACDTPACVNPSHLFLGTQTDNMRDCAAKGRTWNPSASENSSKTHCPQGHPYDSENTYVYPPTGHRQCKRCMAARNKARHNAAKIRQLIGDTLGHRTYMVTVERG